jgi:hypothetical protein
MTGAPRGIVVSASQNKASPVDDELLLASPLLDDDASVSVSAELSDEQATRSIRSAQEIVRMGAEW